MFSISTTVALGIVAAFLVGYIVVQKLLKADKTVDLWQEDKIRLAGILKQIKFDEASEVCVSVGAINVSGTIEKLRALQAKFTSPAAMMEILQPHFYYQLPMRLEIIEDRIEVVKLVLGHPETKAAIQEALKAV